MNHRDRKRWQKIADQMARDNKRQEQKDEELMKYLRDNPGGLFDSLVQN